MKSQGTTNDRPLPEGSKIEYCGMPAVVKHDDGGRTIEIYADGFIQTWYWEFEGVECKIIEVAK